MNSETIVTATTASELMLNPTDPREREILVVEREFQLMQRKANVLASSDIVPVQFKGKLANCVIAMEIADRLKTGVMEIMQNLYVVHGNPAFSSKYLIAMINRSGILTGRLRFEFVGESNTDEYGCYAVGIEAASGQELKGTTVTVDMAKQQGWWGKNGSKWPTMTDQMLQYRAAAFWSRINAPEATMGMGTVEEQVDSRGEIDITPGADRPAGSVADMINNTVKSKGPAAAKDENDDNSGSALIEGQAEEVKQEPHGGDVVDVTEVQTGVAPAAEDDTRPWPRFDNGFWHASDGVIYDETQHGWSGANERPAVNGDGTFRAKRGTGAPAKQVAGEMPKDPPEQEQQKESENPAPDNKRPVYSDTFHACIEGLMTCQTPTGFINFAKYLDDNKPDLFEGEFDIILSRIEGRKEFLKNEPTG